MDENEKRNEIAATLFSVLFGLALLLLLGILFGRGCSGPQDEPPVVDQNGAASSLHAASPETPKNTDLDEKQLPSQEDRTDPVNNDVSQTERRLELAADKRTLEQELAELKTKRKEEFDRVAGERDALKLNTDKRIEELEGTTSTLKSKVDQMEGNLDTANRAKSELQKKLDAALAVQKDLEAKVKAQGEVANKLAGITKEKSDLNKKLAAATAASVAAKTALGVGKTDLQKSEANNANFKKQIAGLESKIDGLGKEKISSTKMISQFKADATAAEKKMAAAKNESDGVIKKLTADNKSRVDEIAKLKTAAGKMGDTSAQLKKLTDQNKALGTEVASLKAAAAKMGSSSGSSVEIERLKAAATKMGNDAKTRIQALTKEKNDLADQVAKLKAAQKKTSSHRDTVAPLNLNKIKAAVGLPELKLPLFVNDPTTLNKRVLPLFTELRGSEDNPQARLKTYAAISKQGEGALMKSIRFESGSSELSAADREGLTKMMMVKDARYLVVGYASDDGDPESNAKLSSKRASIVAEQVATVSAKNDQVEAVYFGQTNRFSKSLSAPNRVIEVWRVK